jgi:Secretion system C-terminal sorting domain
MKKQLLLILVLSAFDSKAQMNEYFPIPDTSIYWRETASDTWCSGCCCSAASFVDRYQLFLNGDTLIESTTYKKIYKTGSGTDYFYGPYGGGTGECPEGCELAVPRYYYNEYMGALRQDTANRKVYFFPIYEAQDTLLYDFDLNLGDALPISYTNSGNVFVSSIDSILISNQYHRRFFLTGNESDGLSIIEGIGSTTGLLSYIGTPLSFSYRLECVQLNGQWTSISNEPDSSYYCQLISGIKENEVTSKISVFPNPFHITTTLEIDATFQQAEIKIFNLIGELVKEQILFENTIVFNREDLCNGIYFFQVQNKNGYLGQGKFIIE